MRRLSIWTVVLCPIYLSLATPTAAQDVGGMINLFGGMIQNAVVQAALAEWKKLPTKDIACIDQALQQRGTSVQALVRQGIAPGDPRIANVRGLCNPQTASPSPAGNRPDSPDGTPVISSSKPTFDCKKAQSLTAKSLCGGPEGARADWALSSSTWAYTAALDDDTRKAFRKEQDEWLKGLIKTCNLTPQLTDAQRDCVVGAFHRRAKAIQAKLTGDALAESNMSPEQRALIQTQLIALGHLNDDADGEFGPNTREAIKKYRQSSGREPGNFLTAEDLRSLNAAARPNPSQFTPNVAGPLTETPRTAQTAARGFSDFATLVEIPNACVSARQIGPSQTHIRNPLTGERVPGPFCAMASQCLATIGSKAVALVNFLNERPTLLNQFRLNREAIASLNRVASSASSLQNVDCGYATIRLANVYPLDGRRSGFEAFALPAQKLLEEIRSEYASAMSAYAEFVPLLKFYDKASDYAQTKANFEKAYNTSDIEEFLRLRSEFASRKSSADAYTAMLVRQASEMTAIKADVSELRKQAGTELLKKVVRTSTISSLEDLYSNLDRFEQMPLGDRGNKADEIRQFQSQKEQAKTEVAAAQGLIDKLNSLERRRKDVVATSERAIALVERPEFAKRLDSDGIALKKALEDSKKKLTKLSDIPLLEREDYGAELAAAENAATRFLDLPASIRPIEELSNNLESLKLAIERQGGARYMEPATARSLDELRSLSQTLNSSQLPLSTERRDRLTKAVLATRALNGSIESHMKAMREAVEHNCDTIDAFKEMKAQQNSLGRSGIARKNSC